MVTLGGPSQYRELGTFPPDYALVGGDLSEDFPGRLASGELFSLGSEQEVEGSFKQLLNLIDGVALPWFPTINSYESYVAYVNRRGFLATSEAKEEIKLGIARGFEHEPFL